MSGEMNEESKSSDAEKELSEKEDKMSESEKEEKEDESDKEEEDKEQKTNSGKGESARNESDTDKKEDDLFGDKSDDEEEKPKKKLKTNTMDDLEDLFRSDSESESKPIPKDSDEETPATPPATPPNEGEGFLNEEEEVVKEVEFGPPEQFPIFELPKPPEGSSLYYTRIPNILGIESRPFDADTYEEVDESKQDGNFEKKIVNPATVLRWRKSEDGTLESNSRFVKWSDGSLQLFVGKEAYDVSESDFALDYHNYLFVKHRDFIQCQGAFDRKLVFRPHSLGGAAHQKLSNAIVNRHKKQTKIKVVATNADPELEKERLEKNITNMQKKMDKKRKRINPDMSSEYIEGYSSEESIEDEDENEGNIGAIKARFAKKKEAHRKRSKEEEEEAERRILKAKETSKQSSAPKQKPTYTEEEVPLALKKRGRK